MVVPIELMWWIYASNLVFFWCKNPFQMIDGKTFGATKMAEQLQEMYEKVKKIIDNGGVEGACDIIEVNFDALKEQLKLGVEGIEHAAMLDIMAELHLTLGDFEEVEHFFLEVSFLFSVISCCVVLGCNVSMGIFIDSSFVFLYMDCNKT
jgi:hypothetical protein